MSGNNWYESYEIAASATELGVVPYCIKVLRNREDRSFWKKMKGKY